MITRKQYINYFFGQKILLQDTKDIENDQLINIFSLTNIGIDIFSNSDMMGTESIAIWKISNNRS